MVNYLDSGEIEQLLQSGRVGRLGCVVNGDPYVVPINYEFRGGAIYGHSLPGLKISALRENPRACLQVDQVESDLRWRSALAFGNFEELTDDAQRQDALTRLMAKYPMMTPVEWNVVHDADTQDIIVFRINIDRMTGVAGS
ncbi:MAG TPA: pyridoxamine 5'-phosphate oxidase family protein [Pyrinomonadaceae bacterium]|nr:pyridoxamine 5'-phosphate oxidase family protein [Pyrinomonadaceae bacterium]